jgi:hypothetical protein
MLETEDAARRLLAAAVSDIPPGIDLLADVRKRRAARRTRARLALAATAAAVIAAATTVALTASKTPSALAAVTAAAAQTDAQSFRLTATSSSPPGSTKEIFSGIFDPAAGMGQAVSTIVNPVQPMDPALSVPRTETYLFIDGNMYIRLEPSETKSKALAGKSWISAPLGHEPAILPNMQVRLLGRILPGSSEGVNPDDLLAALRSVSQVREIGPASGPGWTGTRYSFVVKPPPSGLVTLSGAVDIDRQGRVRVIEYEGITQKVYPEFVTARMTATMAFGDFGVAVSVTAPPASEVFVVH